jgi:rhodanese-related sulfurtransferase
MDTIDVATFRQLQKDPMVRVLDVRSGGEFESAHIPGSYNVPLDTLVEHVGEFVHPGEVDRRWGRRRLALHGGHGHLSGIATRLEAAL